jgi:PAS domain-containing protein
LSHQLIDHAAKPGRDQKSETSLGWMVNAMPESAVRLNRIIQSTMDAIITVDERQDIVIFNSAAEQMFGCAAVDRLGSVSALAHTASRNRLFSTRCGDASSLA